MPDERLFIKVHNRMPDHPKVVGLSDKAFRGLVRAWCWSDDLSTDGMLPRSWWTQLPPKVRRELLTPVPGYEPLAVDRGERGIELHDYLEHQRSADTKAGQSEQKRKAAAAGNHTRHHLGAAGKPTASCPLCVAEGLADASQVRSQNGSERPRNGIAAGSQKTRGTVAEIEESLRDSQTETDLPVERSGGGRTARNASASATPPHDPSEQGKHPEQPCGQQHDPAVNCWRCGQARRAAEQAAADGDTAERERRADAARRRRDCEMCDENGWIEDPTTGAPFVRCDHTTLAAEQIANAMAARS